jgi:hypothetical protein
VTHDLERPDVATAAMREDSSPGVGDGVTATIGLWRAPNRIWPAFPALVVVRAASRLGRGKAERRSSAVGEGGVVSVFLDGEKLGVISSAQGQRYKVSAGAHSLSLHFLGGLRRSRKLHVSLAPGEQQQFVCVLNAFAWPTLRPATSDDVAAMNRQGPAPVDGSSSGAES